MSINGGGPICPAHRHSKPPVISTLNRIRSAALHDNAITPSKSPVVTPLIVVFYPPNFGGWRLCRPWEGLVRSLWQLNGQTAGGAVLIVISIIALVSTSALEAGSLAEIGPALIPRALAALLLILGAVILLAGLRAGADGERLQAWKLRPMVSILGGIILFGLTVRTIGIVFAAPLALMTAGFATAETRWGELALFVLCLTVFCSVLFRFVLGLSIPLAPWLFGY
jgi:Tripartite tricarboxylate transporter TctB family